MATTTDIVLAYIFTSGTTGQSKCSVVTNRMALTKAGWYPGTIKNDLEGYSLLWREQRGFDDDNVHCVKINSNDHRSSPISASEHVAKRKEKRNPADCVACIIFVTA